MTLNELIRIKDQLIWARSKALTGGMFDAIVESLKVIEGEIKLKEMDPRK